MFTWYYKSPQKNSNFSTFGEILCYSFLTVNWPFSAVLVLNVVGLVHFAYSAVHLYSIPLLHRTLAHLFFFIPVSNGFQTPQASPSTADILRNNKDLFQFQPSKYGLQPLMNRRCYRKIWVGWDYRISWYIFAMYSICRNTKHFTQYPSKHSMNMILKAVHKFRTPSEEQRNQPTAHLQCAPSKIVSERISAVVPKVFQVATHFPTLNNFGSWLPRRSAFSTVSKLWGRRHPTFCVPSADLHRK